MRRLLAWVESPGHVCSRYRLAAYRPFLERAGYQLELRVFPRRSWTWFREARALAQADAVIVQRKFLHPVPLYFLRRLARLLLYDFDDAVFLHDSYDRRGLEAPVHLRRFAALVRTADAIIAGNAHLGAQAARWTRAKCVHVVPTCIDPGRYPLAEPRRRGQGVELVWIGSSSTLQGLEASRSLLEGLGQRWPGLRLKLICDRFLELQHLSVKACRWSEGGEATALASSDIGISWVPDDAWSLGKCGLKILQYMAAGLPVVANPVGVHLELVRHGETGFLAKTAAQWAEAIGRLAHDPQLRRRLGRAGRQLVEEKFSVADGASRWLALLESLHRRRHAA